MEPSGNEASESRSKDKGNVAVIDVDSENVNQHIDKHIDEHVTGRVDEQKKKRTKNKKKQTKFSFKPATMGESKGKKASKKVSSLKRLIVKESRVLMLTQDGTLRFLCWKLLELIECHYTSYFYNETEDGGEGIRMIPKTKKNKKNVVGFLTRMIGQIQGNGYDKKGTKSKQNRTKPSTKRKAWKSQQSEVNKKEILLGQGNKTRNEGSRLLDTRHGQMNGDDDNLEFSHKTNTTSTSA
nr:hypothetical protein [Tanacetum cinerariifolium]